MEVSPVYMNFKRIKLITTVPPQQADALRQALGEAGAGRVGEYSYCSFSRVGKGRFMPSENANPYIGQVHQLETVEEEQVEVICERNVAKQVIEALRSAHPYEEPIIDIVPLLDENDL